MRASFLFIALAAVTILSVDMLAGVAEAGTVCGNTGCYTPQVHSLRQRKLQPLGRPLSQPLGQPITQSLIGRS